MKKAALWILVAAALACVGVCLYMNSSRPPTQEDLEREFERMEPNDKELGDFKDMDIPFERQRKAKNRPAKAGGASLCSSPISTSTRWKKESSEFSDAGIIRPHIAIRVRSPSVFRHTVWPPVFGPVITSVSKSFPKYKSTGTTLSEGISG